MATLIFSIVHIPATLKVATWVSDQSVDAVSASKDNELKSMLIQYEQLRRQAKFDNAAVNQSRTIGTDSVPQSKQPTLNDPIALRRRPSPPKSKDLGRWIGSTWIPPAGWQYYAPEELLELYKQIKIWWFGDSMGRRTSLTFYHILNSTKRHKRWYVSKNPTSAELDEDRMINLNKKVREENCTLFQDNVTRFPPSVCRRMPDHHVGDAGFFMQTAAPCALDVEFFLEEQIQNRTTNVHEFQVIIIFIGAWENFRRDMCQGGDSSEALNRTRLDRYFLAVDACDRFTKVYPGVHIVWRTQGFAEAGTMPQKFPKLAIAESKEIMDRIDALQNSQVSYIDWGAAIYDRSLGDRRINGDSVWHYGVEPRVVLIQMLTNHLLDRDVLSLEPLAPYRTDLVMQ